MYIAGTIPCGVSSDPLANIAPGMGCVDCGGTCGGMGLFEAGVLAVDQWGWKEWAAVIGGLYVASSVLFTTKRAASRVAAIPGERRKRRAKYYRDKANELTRKKKK